MGKLVAAFIMFLAASALAIHESKPTSPPRIIEVPPRIFSGDIPDIIDKCPDQPTSNDDEDGCPEPSSGVVNTFIVE